MAAPNNAGSLIVSDVDTEFSAEELEEKQRLIKQILDLQNTLDALQHRVDSVREENLKLRQENGVLSQYIENLMANSTVFHSDSPKADKAARKSSTNKK